MLTGQLQLIQTPLIGAPLGSAVAAPTSPSLPQFRFRLTIFRSAWLMEVIEKVGVGALLLGGVASAVAHDSSPTTMLFLLPNLLVVALLLARRRATEIGDGALDWILPLAASAAPQLLVAVSAPPLSANWLAPGCMALGGCLSLASILSLGRSFGIFPANRGVKRRGPYALVRHPMYLGYGLWQLGFVLANPGQFNAVVLMLATGLQVWRIQREERVLAGDSSYLAYRRRVPARLIPGLY